MTKHHDDGIKMAQMAVEKASRPELRDLAQKMIDDQQKDIDKLRNWRDAWAKDAPKNEQNTHRPLPGTRGAAFPNQSLVQVDRPEHLASVVDRGDRPLHRYRSIRSAVHAVS